MATGKYNLMGQLIDLPSEPEEVVPETGGILMSEQLRGIVPENDEDLVAMANRYIMVVIDYTINAVSTAAPGTLTSFMRDKEGIELEGRFQLSDGLQIAMSDGVHVSQFSFHSGEIEEPQSFENDGKGFVLDACRIQAIDYAKEMCSLDMRLVPVQ